MGCWRRPIILDGFSKTYSMTGWRLGYGVMPHWLANAVNQLMVNSNSCTASFTQRAGIAALDGPQDAVDEMVAEFRRRRDAIVKGLNEIPGLRCALPAGAFYAFPNVTGTGCRQKSLRICCLTKPAWRAYGVPLSASTATAICGSATPIRSENILEAIERIKKISNRWTK